MSEPTPPTPPTQNNYKDTLNLPKTAFDMKANLTQREPEMVKRWAGEDLYGKIRGRAHPKGKWVLHDGPPYANGDIHMGHLINKVLKDIVVKFRTMQGHDSPYVPGWDCHGLPIESAIQKELGPKFRELTKDEVRKRCAAYAGKYVKLQGDSFQRLGVFGDFARPYLTMDPKYEAGILEVLAELVKGDLVYRQKKPVHWCTNDRTALAEAELEYQTKKDTSVYVNFFYAWKDLPAAFMTFMKEQNSKNTSYAAPQLNLMIWTTTPWTLPANRAVAIQPDADYVLVQYDFTDKPKMTVLAKPLVVKVMAAAGVTHFETSEPVTGRDWVATKPLYLHPLEDDNPDNDQPVVLADYVTLEDGTGLVHTAPGHGKEDYQTGMKYGLEVYNPVLSDGRYDETVPEFLRGKTIWEANALVVEKLKETGALFHANEFEHEYPHCWRCKKPVIFRATEQWFVKASGEETRNAKRETRNEGKLWSNAKRFVGDVKWVPAWGRNRIDGMLDTRPDWCISRQRSWGVPIPAFFDAGGRCLLTEASVRRCGEYFRERGADSWYTDSPAQILGLALGGSVDRPAPTESAGFGSLKSLGFPADVDVATLEKGMDILDVWFESGASHHAVLECTHPELGYPANMYLEGSDQHRGWFQSSLLEASGYKAVPPFKEVLTHGFIVDEKGRKMSKSEGNDIKVNDALKQYGADILRLWVSSVDYQNDIACGPNLLKSMGEAYRKIRNTIRYLLGNLYDFNPGTDMTAARPHSIDAWMQSKVDAWAADIYAAYDRYEFHTVFKLIYEFCNVEISAVYAKAIKDRLYCELPTAERRRASQTVCYKALVRLIELTAPVLVFTAEESWQAVRQLPGCAGLEESVHLRLIGELKSEASEAGAKNWAVLMPLIEKGNKQLDELKKTIGLGNALDAEAVIVVPSVQDDVSKLIAEYAPEIEDALGVGFHRVEHGEIWDIKINDTRNLYPSCARSWKRRPDVGSDSEFPDLSKRDADVVRSLREKV